MAENDSFNNRYTPNSNAVGKANSVISRSDDSINRVSSNTGVLSDSNSKVLGVLNDIGRQQSANRVASTRQLNRIVDILDSKDSAPLRNRHQEMTGMIDIITSLKDEIKSASTSSTGNDSIETSSTTQEMLEELRKLNEKSASMGTNIQSGFQASLDEAEKRATLEKKIEEIKKKREEQNKNVLQRQIVNGSVQIGEAIEKGLSETVQGVTKAIGFAMGDQDKKLLGGIMMSVAAFKASIDGFKNVTQGFSKAGKWFKGIGKNEEGEEGSSIEEKTLAKYEEQLEQVKESHNALLGISGNLDLENELAYQQLMAELTEDIEKDLTDILSVFNNGPRGGTTDELINDMPEVAQCCSTLGIDDIRSVVKTPTDLLEDLVDQNEDLVEIQQKQAEKEDNKKDKAKLSTDKDDKKKRLNESFTNAQNENDKKKNGGLGGMLAGLRGMKGIVDVIRGVSKAFNVLKTAFNVIRTVVMGVGAAIAAFGGFIFSFVGAIVIAIAAVVGAIWYFWDDIVGFWDDLTQWFSDGWDSLVSSWDKFWDDPLKPVRDAWDGFMTWMSDSIEYLLFAITNPVDAAEDALTGDSDRFNEYKREKKEQAEIEKVRAKEEEVRMAKIAAEKQAAAEEEERIAKQERIDARKREKWAKENQLEAVQDFFTPGDANYDKFKEEERIREEKEDAESEAEWAELNKPTPKFITKPKDQLYTDEEIETWPGYGPFIKRHNSFARLIIGTRKNEAKAKAEEKAMVASEWKAKDKNNKLPLEDMAIDDKNDKKSGYNIDIMDIVSGKSKPAISASKKPNLNNIVTDEDSDEDSFKLKNKDELYTDKDFEEFPWKERFMKSHNGMARLIIGTRKNKEAAAAKQATSSDLNNIVDDQNKKDAAATKKESSNVNIQNNTNTSNVTSNGGGGGGNKTYVYSGIVPTAPQGGVIIGATD